MSVCNWPYNEPMTADEAREAMRLWLMHGGFNAWQPNGHMQLTQTSAWHAGGWLLDRWAVRMVLGGFGLRILGGIELNDAGLALWQETHP